MSSTAAASGFVVFLLSVQGFEVEVSRSYLNPTWMDLKCLSSSVLPDRPSYYWYKNGHYIRTASSSSITVLLGDVDSYSCAVRGYEDQRSTSVYGPKLPSVSVSPSAEIVEGSSVTLTCSSDANPAANYTWYKEDVDPDPPPLSEEPQLVFSSIQSSDSGQYYCRAENQLGRDRSEFINVNVKSPDKTTTMILHHTRFSLVVVIPMSLLLFCLWMRKKKAVSSTTEPHEPIETVELDSCPEYENDSNTAAQTEDSEEQEDRV